jgi:ABC-type Fe3+-siderophore transport system permease subunit
MSARSVGRVSAMRTRRPLVHLAALAVAVAVGAHLLMHLQPEPSGSAEPVGVHAEHGATTSAVVAAGVPDHGHSGQSDLMAALCMAVLAAAALTVTIRLVGRTAPVTAGLPAGACRDAGSRLRAPPSFASRIDAGVLLRV